MTCRTPYFVALVALCVGLARSLSWDYAVTTSTTLEFYNPETLTHSEDFELGIKYLTYDAVQNRMLFLDRENTRNVSLRSLNLATMDRQSFFMIELKNDYDYIHSLAYDPFTELVYFSNSKAIFWFSLKPGYKNNFNGNLLIESQSTSTVFLAIAVDSCRGYIYWAGRDGSVTTIERARLTGSDREINVVNDPGRFDYLVIDQQTQKLYFINEYTVPNDWTTPGSTVNFLIESRGLNRGSLDILYRNRNRDNSSTQALTVSKDFVYWMDWEYTVWKVHKNVKSDKIYTNSFLRPHYSIVANYKIEDQIQGVQDCQALSKNPVSNGDSLNVPTNENLVCHNYCIQGNCRVIEGQAMCRCNAGYSGDRCTLNICQGYCLNDGDCYLNENSEPVCQCKGDYTGERCAVSGFLKKCYQTVSLLKDILSTDVTPVALDDGVNSKCTK